MPLLSLDSTMTWDWIVMFGTRSYITDVFTIKKDLSGVKSPYSQYR